MRDSCAPCVVAVSVLSRAVVMPVPGLAFVRVVCGIVPAVQDSDYPHNAAVSTQGACSAILALANVSQVMPSHETTPEAHLADVRAVRCGVGVLYYFCCTFALCFVSIPCR